MTGHDAPAIPTAHLAALRHIVATLARSPIDWALTGSTSFALQGVPVAVGDIDVQTDAVGAYASQQLEVRNLPEDRAGPRADPQPFRGVQAALRPLWQTRCNRLCSPLTAGKQHGKVSTTGGATAVVFGGWQAPAQRIKNVLGRFLGRCCLSCSVSQPSPVNHAYENQRAYRVINRSNAA